jgi:hypothetical protein
MMYVPCSTSSLLIRQLHKSEPRNQSNKKFADLVAQCCCYPPQDHAASAKFHMKLSASAQAAGPSASSPPLRTPYTASSPCHTQPKIKIKSFRPRLLHEVT